MRRALAEDAVVLARDYTRAGFREEAQPMWEAAQRLDPAYALREALRGEDPEEELMDGGELLQQWLDGQHPRWSRSDLANAIFKQFGERPSDSQVRNWCLGVSGITPERARQIAAVTGLPVENLVTAPAELARRRAG